MTWLAAIKTAAPEVKPTTTVCETKFTKVPRRKMPSSNWNTPTKKVKVSTSATNCGLPGSASGLMVANTTMEIAVVGPDTKCQDEPHSAATTAGSIAAYKPYSGGMPAIVAKATPCGTKIKPPVRPASPSARKLPRLTRGHQRKKGSRRSKSGCIRRKL